MPSATASSGSDDAAARARSVGRDGLSLALLEARNELLARWAQVETAAQPGTRADDQPAPVPAAAPGAREPARASARWAARRAARAGGFQEWWIGRHVQRARGEEADPASPRLPGLEPRFEERLSPGSAEGEHADADAGADTDADADAEAVRDYLGRTLEQTLDLLGHADDDAAGLYFFRLALQNEDRLSEEIGHRLATFSPPPRAERAPVGVPAQRFLLGSERGPRAGALAPFVPHGERWAHEAAVPEFEIDAQCVNWSQFAEFAEDGGYDRRECWSDAGWAWLQRDGRRAPRGVEQLAGSVVVERFGTLVRAPAQQPAMQVTRHEAEAWCRWAGRRLPTEPEWELAALTAARRGFHWGDVLEWVAGSARPYPGAGERVPPGTLDVIVQGANAPCGVLRGCTGATPARWRHPKARRFALAHADGWRSGFRSCAI